MGKNKTIRCKLSFGNTIGWTSLATLLSGTHRSWSPILGRMDRRPQAKFKVTNEECFLVTRRYKVARPMLSSFV